jgi:adenylate cyclase
LQEAGTPNSILISAAVADYLENDVEIVKGSPLQFKGIDETVLTFSIKSTWLDPS